MKKYPTINYIGNKDKLTNSIIAAIPFKEGTVLDLFCGGCSVAYALKQAGFSVTTNDVLYSNFVISKAIIENNTELLSPDCLNQDVLPTVLTKWLHAVNILQNRLYYQEELEDLAKLFAISNQLPEYQKYMLLTLIRRAMIRKLPYSRMNVVWEQIQKLRDEEYSYSKYGRRRAYHNKSFSYHVRQNLNEYNDSVFSNNQRNMSFQMDCFEFLDSCNAKYDLIYIDPPYPGTMNKYQDFYGLFDEVTNRKIPYTDLTNSNDFFGLFEELIQKCFYHSNNLLISFNTSIKPSLEILSNMLEKYGNTKITEIPHQYKLTGKEKKNQSQEVLILVTARS